MKKRIMLLLLAGMMTASASSMSGCATIAALAVIGIMNNANESTNQSNASELDASAKTLYSSVVSGVLTSDTPSDELNKLSSYKLPDKGSSVQECKDAAAYLTIQDAIDYNGLYNKFDSSNISDYGYDSVGTIYYIASAADTELTVLSLDTTFGEMYNR